MFTYSNFRYLKEIKKYDWVTIKKENLYVKICTTKIQVEEMKIQLAWPKHTSYIQLKKKKSYTYAENNICKPKWAEARVQ